MEKRVAIGLVGAVAVLLVTLGPATGNDVALVLSKAVVVAAFLIFGVFALVRGARTAGPDVLPGDRLGAVIGPLVPIILGLWLAYQWWLR